MAIPTYDQFIYPVLEILGKHPEGLRSRDVYEAVANYVDLKDEERSALLPSGRQAVYQNRIGWAQDRLKRAGLTEAPSRGFWKITVSGRAFLESHHDGLDEATLRELTQVPADSTLSATVSSADHVSAPEDKHLTATQSPEERIDRAMEELNDSVASELIDLIHKSSPSFFERLGSA